MDLSQIIELIKGTPHIIPIIIILLMSFLEISKIKINPWSTIGKVIGNFIGIKTVTDKIDKLEKKVDENQATTIRVRILRFEDDLQSHKVCSKDSWKQVLDDIGRYEQYVSLHPDFKNEIVVASINHIRKGYSERLEKSDWSF